MSDMQTFHQIVRFSREFLEGTVQDVTDTQARWTPPGRALSIAGNYGHVIAAQDFALHLLTGDPMLASGAWAGKTGMAEMPPTQPNGPLYEWSRRTSIDMSGLRAYASGVYETVDGLLLSAEDGLLSRPIDLSAVGFGEQPASFILTAALIANVNAHCGEISCLKGLQDAKGYPL